MYDALLLLYLSSLPLFQLYKAKRAVCALVALCDDYKSFMVYLSYKNVHVNYYGCSVDSLISINSSALLYHHHQSSQKGKKKLTSKLLSDYITLHQSINASAVYLSVSAKSRELYVMYNIIYASISSITIYHKYKVLFVSYSLVMDIALLLFVRE